MAFLSWVGISSAQESQSKKLRDLRMKVSDLGPTSSEALPTIKEYLFEAKKQKDYSNIADAFDGLSANVKDPDLKLKYADSAIISGKKSRDHFTIGTKYLAKGSILYFQFRSYQQALNNFLQAQQYLSHPADNTEKYFHFKNLYFIGATKAYLGQYNEALSVFNQCLNFYKPIVYSDDHPNNIYNFKKGYLNCLVMIAFCYQSMDDFPKAENLIAEGLKNLPTKEFENEKSYLLQLRGIDNYHKDRMQNALNDFAESSRQLIQEHDFGRLQINNLYTAKVWEKKGDKEKASLYFKKNDSIFQKHNFLFPQARDGYEFLIKIARDKGDKDHQLFYTTQLLKADKMLEKDFKVLSSRIHKEFDTAQLVSDKKRLLSKSRTLDWFVSILGSLVVLSIGYALFQRNRNRKIQERFEDLQTRFNQKVQILEQTSAPALQEIREMPIENKDWEVLALLKNFEQGTAYTQKGLTISQLASNLGVPTSDLSRVINEHKGVNFSRYLSGLRIAYITRKLFEDKKYLDYKIEALATECGIASRQNFSDLFTEINGMRPKEFVTMRKAEVESAKS